MQKYKVISLSVSGKAPRKVYYGGEIVTQDNLDADVEELEKQGFIEKAEDDYVAPDIHIPQDPFSTKLGKQVVEVEVKVVNAPKKEEVKKDEKADEPGEKTVVTETQPIEKKDEKLITEDKDGDKKRAEIMEELKAMGVQFNPNASKAELFDLYKLEVAKRKDAKA